MNLVSKFGCVVEKYLEHHALVLDIFTVLEVFQSIHTSIMTSLPQCVYTTKLVSQNDILFFTFCEFNEFIIMKRAFILTLEL